MTAARLWVLSCVVGGALFAQPSHRITAPADRTVVQPGQLVTIKVAVSGKFAQVGVIAWRPVPTTPLRAAPPYEFTIPIPDHITPGPYQLTAVGLAVPGHPIDSIPITLQVEEPADSPMSLDVHPHFDELYPGDKSYLQAIGTFPDGRSTILDQSIHTSFRSSAPNIATVDAQGVVTPVAPGYAKIIVTYRAAHAETSVTVFSKRR
jgi:hypothetical protein